MNILLKNSTTFAGSLKSKKTSIMKKRLSIKRTGYLILFFWLSVNVITYAQDTTPKSRSGILAIDPKIRYGQLENGMTYYIRHNETQKKQAEFYLVQNTGSLQEANHQKGLAHFLEYMAMNSSMNFPEKGGIRDYIESIGMRMDENIKTSTGFDETVYMLMNVPVNRQGIIDSSLLILHDWSSALLFDEENIEKERKVIREAWQNKKNTQMRLLEQQLPVMYPESKYGVRLPNSETGILPIGILGIIENIPRQELIDYYKTWYRPDLQALIIVGDINVDRIEKQIQKIFADIPQPINPKPKDLYVVPDNEIPLICIAKDKEIAYTQLSIFYKFDQLTETLKGTIADFTDNYSKSITSFVMNERLKEIIQKPESPFSEANIHIGDYFVAKTKRALTATAIVKPNEIEKALNTLVTETERIKELGITENEYKRAIEDLLKKYEKAYNDRNNENNSKYAREYINHFTNKDYIPGIEIEYESIKLYTQIIPVEGVNNFIKYILKDDSKNKFKNIVITVNGTDKKEVLYPSTVEIADFLIKAQRNALVEEDEEVDIILIPQLPQPGKIISERKNKLFGTTDFKLSNGATVVIKQTDFKENEILMNALSPGGTSMFKDEKDLWNIKFINTAIQVGGLGQHNHNTVNKALKGKTLSFQAGLTSSSEVITASVAPKDIKTLFEITYLHFTDLRQDNEVYNTAKKSIITQINNESTNPNIIFINTLKELLYDNNPRDIRLTEADFEKINYERMLEMFKERFADASDFVFTFVGNIHIDTIRPLIEQYIASLPTVNRKDIPDESQETPFKKGIISRHFKHKLEAPLTTIELKYTGKMPYNLKNITISQVLNSIIEQLLFKHFREDENDIENAEIRVDLSDFPVGNTNIDILLVAKPEIYEKLLKITKSELERLANKGPTETELLLVKRIMTRQMERIMNENSYWLEKISGYYFKNLDEHTQYMEILNNLTIKDIWNFTKDFLSQGNLIEVVMLPE